MTLRPRTSRARAHASLIACMAGLLCYLLLPALHAFHVHPHEGHGGHWGHVAEHHAHHEHAEAGHDAESEEPAETPHDSHACDVCRVFFATQLGTDLPPTSALCAPIAAFVDRSSRDQDGPVVATWSCDRRL